MDIFIRQKTQNQKKLRNLKIEQKKIHPIRVDFFYNLNMTKLILVWKLRYAEPHWFLRKSE